MKSRLQVIDYHLREALHEVESLQMSPVQNVPGMYFPTYPNISQTGVTDMWAITIVEQSASGEERTRAVMKMIDFVRGAKVFNAVALFCNRQEVEEGTLPAYLFSSRIRWIADTVNAIYDNSPVEVFREYCIRCQNAGAIALMIDDMNTHAPGKVQKMLEALRPTDNRPGCTLPVIGSLYVHAEFTDYPGIIPARQFYRQGAYVRYIRDWTEKYQNATGIVNLEAFRAGNRLTTPEELIAMYQIMESGFENMSYLAYCLYDNTKGESTNLMKASPTLTGKTSIIPENALWIALVQCGMDYWLKRYTK